ncbi:hypothetical protein KX816_12630 [Sphingosinicellaceae bacterium]|nr:hypothetical protein KX816_12630 [Sphingosinicellaceae bacterium]
MHQLHTVLIAIAATLSSGALAAGAPSTATLAAPALQAQVTSETGVWHCKDNTCTGVADTHLAAAVATCTMLAGVNGPVASFTAGGTAFGEAELKRCNRHVK